jgi:hypothetical protein
MKNKNAELTTQQLITIIILIVSFAVILFFIFRLNLGGEITTKEICHNSVLMREKSLNPINSGPLDCRTSYICISGGEKCENFNSGQEIVKINLGGSSEEVKNQIMKVIADEMADCWWMFGEGKIDYVGGTFSGTSSCAICSVISFNKDIQNFAEENNKITYENLFDYLKTNEKESGKTYLYYLYETSNYDNENSFFKTPIEFRENQEIITGIYKQNFLLKVFSIPWVFTKSLFTDDKGKEKDTGPITVIIQPKENIGNLGCGEFVTKA